MRAREMVDAAAQERIEKVELERNHLRPEAKRKKIILPCPDANRAAAVDGELVRMEELLEAPRVRLGAERR